MFKLSSMYIPKLWVWKVKKKGKKRDSQLVKLRFAAFVLFLSTFFEQLQYSVIFVEMQEKLFGSLYKNTIKYFGGNCAFELHPIR